MDRLIAQVRENKTTKQKSVTIPKENEIKCGDYVEIKKIK